MKTPDKIVLEHAGALGDFLLAWPAFLSISRQFPGVPAYFAVRPSLARFLSPLASPCPPDIRRGLDARFHDNGWPDALKNVLVVRPGLAIRPEMTDSPDFVFLHGVVPGRWDSPRDLYRQGLARRGIAFAEDWRETFQVLFGRSRPIGDTVLLFPGAGHTDKCWAMDHFEALAGLIATYGCKPVFVLGPAELERCVAPKTGETLSPPSTEALSQALCAARCVVGPDCGPLHLAGMHGVPGVAIFGPTAPDQWGPDGLAVVTAGLPCSPCTGMTSGEFAANCLRPLSCLTGVSIAAVWERVQDLLSRSPARR
ncbi:glycosyltransferase family 9 protein [Desulfovibrio sp. TomC]|uniref:glycosyltransferase family 9 protein n=1 Tax=Desulfovibrio sp. TomC TaxID=1562888 RepID=UPI0005740B9D|nr:glycosyltransferase family 9 protein [Desulfovibrio sp. TomC]KHK04133.1 Lipopolysaccharide heptosyltransferase III [Desulfovibrio sp. TomC]